MRGCPVVASDRSFRATASPAGAPRAARRPRLDLGAGVLHRGLARRSALARDRPVDSAAGVSHARSSCGRKRQSVSHRCHTCRSALARDRHISILPQASCIAPSLVGARLRATATSRPCRKRLASRPLPQERASARPPRLDLAAGVLRRGLHCRSAACSATATFRSCRWRLERGVALVSQATRRFAPLPRRDQETLLVQGLLHLQHTPGGPPRALLARGALRFSVTQGFAYGASSACANAGPSLDPPPSGPGT